MKQRKGSREKELVSLPASELERILRLRHEADIAERRKEMEREAREKEKRKERSMSRDDYASGHYKTGRGEPLPATRQDREQEKQNRKNKNTADPPQNII